MHSNYEQWMKNLQKGKTIKGYSYLCKKKKKKGGAWFPIFLQYSLLSMDLKYRRVGFAIVIVSFYFFQHNPNTINKTN